MFSNMIKKEYIKALKKFHKHISTTNMKWCITGKFNLSLQGINLDQSKIGILIDFEDLNRFLFLFSEFEHTDIEELKNGEAKEFVLFINKIKFLICAEYPYGIYRQLNANIISVRLDDIIVPCFALESERKAYNSLKMFDKAKLISDYLVQNVKE